MFEHTESPETEQVATRRRLGFGKRTIVTLMVAGGMLGGGVVGSAVTAAAFLPQSATAAPSAQTQATVAGAVYKSVSGAVVEINVSSGGGRRGMTQSGTGSGFVIDSEGYILTNAHVVSSAQTISVQFASGEERTGQLVGSDTRNDLALIKVDLPENTPVVTLGDSDAVQVGDTAIAIGSPFGLENTLTQGIISAVQRDWSSSSGSEQNMLQTDAPINPGNSGGPLLNASGEVIGINTAIESPVEGSVGIGFAIPINTAKSLLSELKQGAQIQAVWLGISGQTVTAEAAQSAGLSVSSGVYVAEVVDSSPAAAAGLQTGDVITKIDETTISTFDDLSNLMAKHNVGDSVKVTLVRNGEQQTVSVTLSARPTMSQ